MSDIIQLLSKSWCNAQPLSIMYGVSRLCSNEQAWVFETPPHAFRTPLEVTFCYPENREMCNAETRICTEVEMQSRELLSCKKAYVVSSVQLSSLLARADSIAGERLLSGRILWGTQVGCASHLRLPQDLALLLQAQDLALLLEHLSRLLQDHLKALFAPGCVLLESLDCELLDAVLDLLPASAQGRDLCSLREGGLGSGCGR
jgi:hypothetical protein